MTYKPTLEAILADLKSTNAPIPGSFPSDIGNIEPQRMQNILTDLIESYNPDLDYKIGIQRSITHIKDIPGQNFDFGDFTDFG